MKEKYEELEIDIQVLPEEDIITTSSPTPTTFAHDNHFIDWLSFE